ncbi:MAG: class I SAM-dependent methyltransferase [Adhaeribacter sp.]
MKRYHLFELEDQAWFPDVLRRNMLDYLRFAITLTKVYEPVVPLLQRILPPGQPVEILDLCSGGGGGIIGIQKSLAAALQQPVHITLTDKFPNLAAFEWVSAQTRGAIGYETSPVDATRVPPHLRGMRTIFSAFHHFKPGQAREILADAARNQVPIGIFEGAGKSYWEIAAAIFLFPFIFLVVTPFIRPFRWSRIFFTYLLPLIPLCTIWDGCVSILRLYTPQHLLQLTEGLGGSAYRWESGRIKRRNGTVLYLIGYPDKDQ